MDDMEKQTAPVYSNVFKIVSQENTIILNFAYIDNPDSDKINDEDITYVKKVVIHPKVLQELILSLYKAGIDYKKSYEKDIGKIFENVDIG